jgi:hypothetical protein
MEQGSTDVCYGSHCIQENGASGVVDLLNCKKTGISATTVVGKGFEPNGHTPALQCTDWVATFPTCACDGCSGTAPLGCAITMCSVIRGPWSTDWLL